ncbi:hypothetical protein DYQ93_11595 [Xanthomonas sp. LMG 8992]|uniref:hypothetical protein n=1 Tax=Xanthomonas sp. LMG 8992 TaxID=1591157 RepID=UPI00136C1629|nr:hypothetical protein [Xanthomonas sp. LMG 8992]MXV11664.1 hypothetical protein [Xanthomonas sp. LMG 8992]
MNTETIRVWQINDYEYWIGAGSAADILAAYMTDTGCTHEEATGDPRDYPTALSDEDLDRLKMAEVDEDENPTGEVRTFREALQGEIAEGGTFPRFFGGSD